MNLRGRRRLSISPGKRAGVILMLLALVIAASAAIAQVWTHLRAIEYGYKISKATRVRDGLLERNRRLRVELQLLKNPTRIAKIAREELGLQPPEPEQIRRLRSRALTPERSERPSRRAQPAPVGSRRRALHTARLASGGATAPRLSRSRRTRTSR